MLTGMTPLSDPRSTRPWLDPLAFASAAVALGVYLLHGFDGELTRDLGVYSYAGQQVADGVAPYLGILNRAGPLAHLIPGVGAYLAGLLGADDILGMRVTLMLVSVACIGLAYLLGRDVFRSRTAGLATAAALLSFQGFIDYATYGPREKSAMVLFTICALLAMVHRRWATTGFFIALATLTWQPVFLPAIGGAVVAAALSGRPSRLRALVRLGVGGLVPAAMTVAAYAAIGEVQVFLDDFLLINARYTDQISLLREPDLLWSVMSAAYGWSLWVFLVGSAAILAAAVRGAASRGARSRPETAALIGCGVVLVTGVLWSFKAFNGWPDNFFMLPVAALGIGGLVHLLGQRLPAAAAVAVVLAWVVAATGASVAYSVGARDETLVSQRAEVAAVVAVLPADARFLSVEAPEVLALAHKRNLTRLQLFGNGLVDYVEATWPGGADGYGRWVGRHKPDVIVLGSETPGWLAPVLDAEYVSVGRSPGWSWFVHRDLGGSVTRRLSDVLDADS